MSQCTTKASRVPGCSAAQEEALLQQMETRQRARRLASICSKLEGQLDDLGRSHSEGGTVGGCPEAADGSKEVHGGVQYAEAAVLMLVSDRSETDAQATGTGCQGEPGVEEDVAARLVILAARKRAVSLLPYATILPYSDGALAAILHSASLHAWCPTQYLLLVCSARLNGCTRHGHGGGKKDRARCGQRSGRLAVVQVSAKMRCLQLLEHHKTLLAEKMVLERQQDTGTRMSKSWTDRSLHKAAWGAGMTPIRV